MSINRVLLFFALLIFVQILIVLYSGTYEEHIAEQSGNADTKCVQNQVFKNREGYGQEEFPITKRYIYRLSKFSNSYKVEHTPKCWLEDCDKQNNYLAYKVEMDRESEEWNGLGVLSMEQYLQGSLERMNTFHNVSLTDALYYFAKGIQNNPNVPRLYFNLGLVLIQKEDYENAEKLIRHGTSLFTNESDLALAYLALGMLLELQGKDQKDVRAVYKMVYELDESVAKSYAGIPVLSEQQSRVHIKGKDEAIKALRDMFIYKYFARHSISDHALYDPGTQDKFIKNQYVYLRNILPPFVLTAYADYVHDLIKHKEIVLGDAQSMRYNMHNDRVSRFIHEQLTDLVRRITAHSVKPSYTYFGGYVAGATLTKHLDRDQCEFTLSLTIERYPADLKWDLSLNKNPITPEFDKEKIKNMEEQDQDVVTVDLKNSDGLLFMGRKLVHYRKGTLKENQWLNQIFLHYVQENFNSTLN
ncbi:uncharacterized protein LOC126330800 [Schistocerca gregaria]|uniref:uncharacterized protein LOC126330800 n=1 Tax=Schistocerca gregaria TaxID=7010 RepID=UPI00211E16BB|nr:uncharacterized protein LOC126330800 [Schistocerca gregaria]